MNPDVRSSAHRRVTTILLITLAVALLAYAISDHPLYGGGPGFGWMQMGIAALAAGVGLSALLPGAWPARVLLLSVSGLLTLAMAEGVGEILLGPRFRPIYQADDRLLFKFLPDRVSETFLSAANGGARVVHRINEDGFRGPELLPAGARKRVVVYGDSFIHAYYSPEEETFVDQLRRVLEQRLDIPIEVVNAGVSSYGPDQISLKMERELPLLEPDLVVVAVFAGNDYGDLLRNKLFRVLANGRIVPNDPVLDEEILINFRLSQQESILKRALRNSLLGDLGRADSPNPSQMSPDELLEFWLRTAEQEYESYVIDGSNLVTNTHQDYYSADVSLLPHSDSTRYEIQLMAGVLARIQKLAADADVPLMLLFIPHPLDVGADYMDIRIDSSRFPEYAPRNQIRPLEEIALDLGVPHLSLFDAYREADPNTLYLKGGDDHWNASGQRLAAELVGGYIVRQDPLRVALRADDARIDPRTRP